MANRYITLDGHKYAVENGSYTRDWKRSFNMLLNTLAIRLNWIDRGPGIKTYKFNLTVQTWPTNSELYNDGITESFDTQVANLEIAYNKVATVLQFLDPFGNPPRTFATGVYMTALMQSIPAYSTVSDPRCTYTIECIEATELL